MYIISSLAYITALFNNNETFSTQESEIRKYIQSYSQWLYIHKPQNKYQSFLIRTLKLKNSYIITIILRIYWWLKKIQKLFIQ